MRKRKGFSMIEVLIAILLMGMLLMGIAKSQTNFAAALYRGNTAQKYYNIDASIYELTTDVKSAEEIKVVSSALLYISTEADIAIYELTDNGLYRNGVQMIEGIHAGEFVRADGQEQAFTLRLDIQTYPPVNLYFAANQGGRSDDST